MSNLLDEQDEISFSEPIMAQKGVRLGIINVEATQWEVKTKDKWSEEGKVTMVPYIGAKYDALKLTLQISDDTVQTEHEGATPKLTIENQFNLVKFPYPDKKDGAVRWLGRQNLYQLEEAFGFDPIFMVGSEIVEPFVTRNGRKAAPKLEGVKRALNPDFVGAYFNADNSPKAENWVGKTIYADISLVKSDQFGDKNEIARYVRAPEV